MRRGYVYNHGRLAGHLDDCEDGKYRFTYEVNYVLDPKSDPVSLTLPKRPEPYVSDHLFSFFYGLLSEGTTRQLQARLLRIDEDDVFGLLLATARDAIGSVTIEPAAKTDPLETDER